CQANHNGARRAPPCVELWGCCRGFAASGQAARSSASQLAEGCEEDGGGGGRRQQWQQVCLPQGRRCLMSGVLDAQVHVGRETTDGELAAPTRAIEALEV